VKEQSVRSHKSIIKLMPVSTTKHGELNTSGEKNHKKQDIDDKKTFVQKNRVQHTATS